VPVDAVVLTPREHVELAGRGLQAGLAVLHLVAVLVDRDDLGDAARAVGDRDVAREADGGPRGAAVRVGAGPVAAFLDQGLRVDLGDRALGRVGDQMYENSGSLPMPPHAGSPASTTFNLLRSEGEQKGFCSWPQ
jgi:hypothetical protein